MTKREKYVQWLMDIVDCDDSYSILFNLMLDRDFRPFVGNDSNRACDGLDLRFEFEEEYGVIHEFMGKPCSELEMFIALARRCETDIMTDLCGDDMTSEWFWIMMKNLKLDECANKSINVSACEQILERFELRKYNFDGSGGGAWVVHSPREDMRKVEIWYQMNWFLVENYSF